MLLEPTVEFKLDPAEAACHTLGPLAFHWRAGMPPARSAVQRHASSLGYLLVQQLMVFSCYVRPLVRRVVIAIGVNW
jgi:hypothetical protein